MRKMKNFIARKRTRMNTDATDLHRFKASVLSVRIRNIRIDPCAIYLAQNYYLGLLIYSVILIGLSTAYAEDAGNIDVQMILKKTDAAEGFQSNYSEAKQIITTSSGKERTLVMRSWSVNNGDKQLAEYLAPPDLKGQ